MDEWAQRVLKDAQESLPSVSGVTRVSRAAAEQNRTELQAGLRKGVGGAGAGALGLLLEEFSKLTGRSGLNKIKNPQYLIDQLKPLLQKRGYEACVQVMKERIELCMKRDGKAPASLKYFIPVFADDAAFKNGTPQPMAAPAAGPPRRTDTPRDAAKMAQGIVEGLQIEVPKK